MWRAKSVATEKPLRVRTRPQLRVVLFIAILCACCAAFLVARIQPRNIKRALTTAPATTPSSLTTPVPRTTSGVAVHNNGSTATTPEKHHGTRKATRLVWNHTVYLPVSAAARKGFQAYDTRLRKRLAKKPWLHRIWGCQSPVVASFLDNASLTASDADVVTPRLYLSMPPFQERDAGHIHKLLLCSDRSTEPPQMTLVAEQRALICECLLETPECEFFLHVGSASVAFVKCCVEHFKLKLTLRNLALVATVHGEESKKKHHQSLQLFLDSGSLLSAVRDGGSTLLPWETDIDLGVVSGDPMHVAPLMKSPTSHQLRSSRPHYVEPCVTDPGTGICKDAHYVYFVSSKSESKNDTSRVEVWPFLPKGGSLHHPTRPWLTVASDVVLPLRRCSLWAIPLWCPANSVAYLDHEYEGRQGWSVPRTIHWGERNVQTWR
ncbi:transmembrane protein, putative [Bodo saltans]|uniref:Transmembrane protein, putative n=1 Tax=Bodo saltans TaxID=75058 RepID=A0A0S4JYE1_BODSA|nr:transmembrane protein, putative [Bodo saltans]|eukprot:CUG94383.1 transmembrane protein, putative [Bodo saltans]